MLCIEKSLWKAFWSPEERLEYPAHTELCLHSLLCRGSFGSCIGFHVCNVWFAGGVPQSLEGVNAGEGWQEPRAWCDRNAHTTCFRAQRNPSRREAENNDSDIVS